MNGKSLVRLMESCTTAMALARNPLQRHVVQHALDQISIMIEINGLRSNLRAYDETVLKGHHKPSEPKGQTLG